jgi:Cu/Ag efflux protein CusF
MTDMRLLRIRFALVIGLLAVCLSTAHAQQPEKKAHTFKGKIEKVDAKAKTLTVNGENVEGWMGAMTMTYVVDKEAVLGTLKTGDQITATVFDGDFRMLHDVKIVPPKDQATKKK